MVKERVTVPCWPARRAAGGYFGFGWLIPEGLLTVRCPAAAVAAFFRAFSAFCAVSFWRRFSSMRLRASSRSRAALAWRCFFTMAGSALGVGLGSGSCCATGSGTEDSSGGMTGAVGWGLGWGVEVDFGFWIWIKLRSMNWVFWIGGLGRSMVTFPHFRAPAKRAAVRRATKVQIRGWLFRELIFLIVCEIDNTAFASDFHHWENNFGTRSFIDPEDEGVDIAVFDRVSEFTF